MQASRWACPQCQWNGHPSFELDASGKLVAQCGRQGCAFTDSSTSPQTLNVGIAVDAYGAESVVSTQVARVAPAPVAPRTPIVVAPIRIGLLDSTSTVLDAARARLADIETEVARLEELRAEGKALARMIAAAERTPRRRAPISPALRAGSSPLTTTEQINGH